MIPRLCILLLLCFGGLFADNDAKYIAQKYQEGVVKLLLYDPILVETFHLKPDQGFISRGSGFFVTEDGVLFTNAHVVQQCVHGYLIADWEDSAGSLHRTDLIPYIPGIEKDPAIKKIYYAGHALPVIQVFRGASNLSYQLYYGEVMSLSETFDGAAVRVVADAEGKELKHARFNRLPLGNSNQVMIGEDLIILGYPSQYVGGELMNELKDTMTISFGKHSGWDYVFDQNNGFIKTDASIHEGNSGGPVFSESRKVIGIATAMGAKTRIGLVGGIDYMYFVVATQTDLFKQLKQSGLTKPERPGNVQTIAGTPRPFPNDLQKKVALERVRPVGETREVTVQGKVRTGDTPVSNAHVQFWQYEDSLGDYVLLKEGITNQDGSFELSFSASSRSRYLILISAPGYRDFMKHIERLSHLSGQLDIQLAPGQDSEPTLKNVD